MEQLPHNTSEEIALGSLDHSHISNYLDRRFQPNDFSPELPSLIYDKTEGHPLFTISLMQFLAESGDVLKVNGRWSPVRPLSEINLEAPENVRSMIRKNIVTGQGQPYCSNSFWEYPAPGSRHMKQIEKPVGRGLW